ncbi:MAG: Na/Pi cotransporter family protein [Hyphomicrobiaceae bacterium]
MAGGHVLLTLLGGVALMLWGVRMVRTGMTRAFGPQLRTMLWHASQRRVTAFGTGVGVTAVLQSSTATALLLSSFAGRGLIPLAPALAIMLGADVGTTLVAQVFALDIKWLWSVALIFGYILFSVGLNDKMKHIGRILMGLGMLLLALQTLGVVSLAIRESTTMPTLIQALSDEVIIAALVGLILTWLAHSSLAMVLFIMLLTASGSIPLQLAVVLVIGANIGGAIAPLTALSGSPVPARRVPLGNLLARSSIALVMLPFATPIAEAIGWIGADAGWSVLLFHMAFNVIVALVFMPLLGPLAELTTRLLQAPESEADSNKPLHLDSSVLETPSEALGCAIRETLHLGDVVVDMMQRSLPAITSNDNRLVKEVEKLDDTVDTLYDAIKHYLIRASKEEMDEQESLRYDEVLSFTTNLEHIGDIVDKNLMELATKRIKNRYSFSPEGLEEITEFHRKVVENFQLALNVFATRDVALARKLLNEKTSIRDWEFEAAERHFERLRSGRTDSIETSSIHIDILRDLKRINSHLTSVAYPILEAVGELSKSRLLIDVEESAEGELPARTGTVET